MRKISLFLVFAFLLGPALLADNAPPNRDLSRRFVTLRGDDLYIRTALRIIADRAKINIAISLSLRGRVSVNAERQPVTRVLAEVVAQVNADYCVEENVIRVYEKGRVPCQAAFKEFELLRQ